MEAESDTLLLPSSVNEHLVSRCMGRLEHVYVEEAGQIYDLITCMKCNYSNSKIIGDGVDCEDNERCHQLISPASDTHVRVTKDEHSILAVVSCSSDGVPDNSASGGIIVDETSMYSLPISVEDTSSMITAKNKSASHSGSNVAQLNGSNFICGKLKRSLTTDGFDLSHESLKHARRQIVELLCCRTCPGLGYELKHVEGMTDVLSCPQCNAVFGLDDSINYYDLLQDLEQGKFTVEPCQICGNTDPDMFLVVLSDECPDTVATFDLKCMICCNDQMSNTNSSVCEKTSSSAGSETVSVDDDLAALEEMRVNLIQCPNCKNNTKDLFHIDKNKAGDILSVKCFSCDHRLVVPRTKCICPDSDYHEVVCDDVGYLGKEICRRCHAQHEFGARYSTPRGDGDGSSLGRTQVKTLAMLKQGDHIAWHQTLSYWHHAIVIHVDERNNKLTIINYDGPDTHKGKVVVQVKDVNPSTEQLYRIDYDITECYHPEEVVARGMDRLGEIRYDLLFNNCEHFARWCKTGKSRSLQSECFFQTIKNRAAAMINLAGSSTVANKLVGSVAKTFMRDTALPSKCGEIATAAVGDAAKKEVSGIVSSGFSLGRFLPAAYIISSEITLVCRDIQDAMQKRRDGHIQRQEFIKIMIKRVSEGGGSLTGVAVAMAVPFTRNTAGLTLGSVIGQGVGAIAGRQFCATYDKVAGVQ